MGSERKECLERLDQEGLSSIPVPSKNESFEPLLTKLTDRYSESQLGVGDQNLDLLRALLQGGLAEARPTIIYYLETRNPFLGDILEGFRTGSSGLQACQYQLEQFVARVKAGAELDPREVCKRRVQKYLGFKELMLYLRRNNWVNSRQDKFITYLYSWEDLNVLSAFEVYLLTADLRDFVESIDIVEQIYFLNEKCELDSEELEGLPPAFDAQM